MPIETAAGNSYCDYYFVKYLKLCVDRFQQLRYHVICVAPNNAKNRKTGTSFKREKGQFV